MTTYMRQPNTLPLAIIGAVCMAIMAATSIYWTVGYIQEVRYIITEYDPEPSDYVVRILYAIAYVFIAAGAVTAGIALFMERSPLPITIGAILSVLGCSICLFAELVWYVPGLFWLLAIRFLLEVTAWGGVFLASLSGTRSKTKALKTLVVATSSAAFIVALIRYIIAFHDYDYFESFIIDYWKGILYWIALVTGLIMIILILSARTESAERMACGQGQPFSRMQPYGQGQGYAQGQRYAQPPAYGQADMYGRDQRYAQAPIYGQSQGYAGQPHVQPGMYGHSQGYVQGQVNAQPYPYGQAPGYVQGQVNAQPQTNAQPPADGLATETLPSEMNVQAPAQARRKGVPQGEVKTSPDAEQTPGGQDRANKRREAGQP